MDTNKHFDFKASEEAALWLHRLQHEDTPEVRADFSAWIRKAAVNLEEFLFAQAVWKEFDHLDPALSAQAQGAELTPSIVGFRAPTPAQAASAGQTMRRPRWKWRAGLAAALVALTGGWMIYQGLLGADTYATTVGDQQIVKLSDGSVIHLNTDSRAEVRYSARVRSVRLVSGEAMFTVARDPARPFSVQTDSAFIQALGTQFNVYRTSGTTTRIAVVEGAVQVSEDRPAAGKEAVKLGAGDEARVLAHHVVKVKEPDVERAVAWRARRLVFPGDRVADVANEFNRYNKTQIRVEGEAIRQRRMSGVFDADDPSPFIEHLARDPTLAVDKADGEIRIRIR